MEDSILLEHEAKNECSCAGKIVLGPCFHIAMLINPLATQSKVKECEAEQNNIIMISTQC